MCVRGNKIETEKKEVGLIYATDLGGYHDLLDRSLGHKEDLCNTISRSAQLSREEICTRDKRGARGDKKSKLPFHKNNTHKPRSRPLSPDCCTPCSNQDGGKREK